MNHLRCEYPLRWPANRPSTPRLERQHRSQVPPTLTIDEALRLLDDEIGQFPHVGTAVLTSNYRDLDRKDRKMVGMESAVTLEISILGMPAILTSDSWMLHAQNIYALQMTLRHLRSLEEWGVMEMAGILHGASRGATDSQAMEGWMLRLGLGPTATLADANAVYRQRARDIGGDAERLVELNTAIAEARKRLS